MLRFTKTNIAVCFILILVLFGIWVNYSKIKIFPCDTKTVVTETNIAAWESGSGVKIDITILNKDDWKSEYLNEWFSEIEALLDSYTVVILDIGLQPKVETLFIDIPANTNARITTQSGEALSPLNDQILERYYQQNRFMKQYLQSVYEETMSNNSPFTLNETSKQGILVFPKCNEIKAFEFNIFNSEADIGLCKVIYE